jgi:hypothetical protein
MAIVYFVKSCIYNIYDIYCFVDYP